MAIKKCKHLNLSVEETGATITHSYKYDPVKKIVKEAYEGCEFNDGEQYIICDDCGEELNEVKWFEKYQDGGDIK